MRNVGCMCFGALTLKFEIPNDVRFGGMQFSTIIEKKLKLLICLKYYGIFGSPFPLSSGLTDANVQGWRNLVWIDDLLMLSLSVPQKISNDLRGNGVLQGSVWQVVKFMSLIISGNWSHVRGVSFVSLRHCLYGDL